MRSRAELRRLGELALRGVALVALGILLWRSLRPPEPAGADVAAGTLAPALARWTSTPPSDARVLLDAAPDARVRNWIRALVASGTSVRWSARRSIMPSAIVAEPASEPHGTTRVRLVSAGSEAVAVGDDAGLIDSLPGGGGAELELAAISGGLRASGATFTATTAARDSVILRPVLVLGAAGWESKFTIAALEERGWRVASRLRVAPGVDVTQGPLGTVDTARYSAVIVLDSTAAPLATAIARYARSGGGVVLAGRAARIGSLASIAPGGVGGRMAGVAGAVASGVPRNGLAVFPVSSIRADGVALESRGDAIVVAARRIDAGRVAQSGYDETWRWRMAGGDEGVGAHREWWSRLVASVAYAPLAPLSPLDRATTMLRDETPLAALVAALGQPTPLDASVTPRHDGSRTVPILFALVVGALLLEWVSRRLRGAR